jgi:hypothetical protein
MAIIIKSKDRDKVWRYVTRAISLFEPHSNTLRNQNIHKCKQYEYALANLIKIDRLKINNQLKRDLIGSAIRRLKSYKRQSLKIFLNCIQLEYENYLKKPRKKYLVVFPINVRYKTLKKRWFNLLGTKIRACSYNHIRKSFDFNEPSSLIQQDPVLQHRFFTHFTYFLVEEYAVNDHQAMDSAFHNVELLRAIINFANHYMRLTDQFGMPKPLSLVHPSQIFFVFNEDGSYSDYAKIIGNFDQNDVDVSPSITRPNIIKRTEILLKKLNSIRDRTLKNILVDALNRHNDALDEYSKKGHCFLNLWQILELVTLSGRYTLKHTEVCRRMASLFREKEPYAEIVDAIRVKRNLLVHDGKFSEFDTDDIHMISGICQGAIMFLLNNSNKFGNVDGLNYFYRNVNATKREIKIKKDIIKYIESNRP